MALIIFYFNKIKTIIILEFIYNIALLYMMVIRLVNFLKLLKIIF